jgi:hypothetical protein
VLAGLLQPPTRSRRRRFEQWKPFFFYSDFPSSWPWLEALGGALFVALGEVFAVGAAPCAGAAAMGAGGAAMGSGMDTLGAGAGSLDAGTGGALVEAEAMLVLAGALFAAFFGAAVALLGAALGRGESATALGADGSLPVSAKGVVEATLRLASATRDSAGAGVALTFDCAVVLSDEDVIRSSTIAPPITTAVIIPIATPKWFTALSNELSIGIGAGSVTAGCARQARSEGAYTGTSCGHTMKRRLI